MVRGTIGILFALGVAVWGQSAARNPEFTVASIKRVVPNPNGFRVGCSGGPGTKDPAYYRCTNTTVLFLIEGAYAMGPRQISGPGWMRRERFNVEARVPAGATAGDLQAMMRNLLAERFGMIAHQVSREVRGFKLVIAKGGPKLERGNGVPGTAMDPSNVWRNGEGGYPAIGPGQEGMAMGHGHAGFYRSNMTLDAVADLVAAELGTPVANATGLSGHYDVGLRWIPMAGQPGAPSGPDLRDAVREQLGLALEPTQVQRAFLIVDRMNQTPAAN